MLSKLLGFHASPRPWAAPVLIALALLAPPAPAHAGGAGEVEHVVSRGQTLVRIARRYRTTVDIIREVNGLRPEDRLRPGQRLVIPERGKEAEAAKRAAAIRKEAERKEAERREKEADRKEKEARGRKGAGDRAEKGKAGKESGGKGKAKEEGYARKPKRPGRVHMVRGAEELEIQLLTRSGRLNPKALPKISHLLRSPAGAIPIDPRLATLVGMVSDHFGGRTIRVVSGYRPYSPTQYTRHSNHNVGRAMDFAVEGVPNTVVRDFCRTLRNAGVGYYPNSTFVHLDVRTVNTYWVDYSRPGERPRYDPKAPPPESEEAVYDLAEGLRPEADRGSDGTPPPAADPSGAKGSNPDVRRSDPLPGENPGPNRPTSSGKLEKPEESTGKTQGAPSRP